MSVNIEKKIQEDVKKFLIDLTGATASRRRIFFLKSLTRHGYMRIWMRSGMRNPERDYFPTIFWG